MTVVATHQGELSRQSIHLMDNWITSSLSNDPQVNLVEQKETPPSQKKAKISLEYPRKYHYKISKELAEEWLKTYIL